MAIKGEVEDHPINILKYIHKLCLKVPWFENNRYEFTCFNNN